MVQVSDLTEVTIEELWREVLDELLPFLDCPQKLVRSERQCYTGLIRRGDLWSISSTPNARLFEHRSC